MNKKCRVSGKDLNLVLDLGKQPLGNGFLLPNQYKDEYFYAMKNGFCEESKMFQLIDQPEPQKMFHDHYAFFSSTSKYMENHFENFALSVIESNYLEKNNPFIVELGCNDGIMLKNFAKKGFKHLGIEPSQNVAKVANENGVSTISEFFNTELAEKIVKIYGKADAFLAANVMCHIPDIKSVAKGISLLLKSKGVVQFEDPYLGDVVEKTSYDQIYDEHVFLFSAHSIQYLFGLYDMELIDVKHQKTHGGSMRYILSHKDVYPINKSVHDLMEKEKSLGLDKIETFNSFKANVEKSRIELVDLLKDIKRQGKKIAGYGATSKSTTILNYCNIGPDLIDYISDTTPIKQGKYSPGMHIPIKPYEFFKENPPDYAFLFAWNHAEEIMAKENAFMDSGGKWIVHVPKVAIL
jgi:SAM-dependent methyltransferase